MIRSESFPMIRMKIDKLIDITNEYIFFDLVKAAYCINLCINNRSVLEASLALNACLVEYKGCGTKSIKKYEEFVEFYERIYSIMLPGYADDYIVEDFGDVKIRFREKFYNVIIGTGHNDVFACLNFLSTLAREKSCEDLLVRILEYSSATIEYFKSVNVNDGEEIKRFKLPSQTLFDRVQSYFKEEFCRYDIIEIAEFFSDNEAVIEKSHFVYRDDNIYPLFNVSILIDLYDAWILGASEKEEIAVANTGIIERIYSLFETDRSKKCLMFAPAMIFPEQKYDAGQRTYTFVVRTTQGVIFAINKDEYSEEELEKEISKIENYHQDGKLHIAETYNRFDNSGLRGVWVSPELPIEFLIYDSFTNPNQMHMILGEANDSSRRACTALDIIYYLNFIDDVDELFDYLSYKKERDYESSFGFGSDAAHYFTWKSQGRYIAKGAIVFNLVDVGYDTENEAVVEYFKNELKDYPFIGHDYMFREPFAWKIEKRDSGEYEYVAKYGMGFGGPFLPLANGNYVFLSNNVEFYKDVADFGEYRQWIQLLEEVIIEGIKSLSDIFNDSSVIYNTAIQLAFMPIEYAVHAGHESFLHEDREYVYSDAQYYNHKWIIRYVVKDIQKIYKDIQEANDRQVEFRILQEVLSPMLVRDKYLRSSLENEIQKQSNAKKRVGVFSAYIDYKWNNDMKNYSPQDYHFHEVRKRIAKVCFAKLIKPGIYRGKEANIVIRNMQKAIVEDFEAEVSKYSWVQLHCEILDYHSTLLHDINVNRKRYGSYSGLDEEKDKEVRDRIIRFREKAKRDDRNALYLIETVLFLHSDAELVASSEDINLLLAYANWLVNLSDVADMCFFADNEAYIEVTDEYVVDSLSDDEETGKITNLHHRVYTYTEGLKRDKLTDDKYLGKIKDSLCDDLKIDFQIMLEVLTFFSNTISDSVIEEKGCNVYSASLKAVEEDFMFQMNGMVEQNEIDKVIHYLTIDTTSLKTENGKTDFFLPIGKRRTRNNRFELAPLLKIDDEIVFAPITLEHLKLDWLNGIMDFVLPYEVGMNNTKSILQEWKSAYEKRIVFDIEKAFQENHFDLIKHNFELKKLSKEHPQWLGDYDVFAVNEKTKFIWIIECKVIEKVATFYDMFRQQNRFFNEHKEDESFQRRIDYLNEKKEIILQQLGLTDCDGYKVVPYMCMNKVLVSRYKKIDFPIVCYSELVEIIATEGNRK